jgi:hypothetical protein
MERMATRVGLRETRRLRLALLIGVLLPLGCEPQTPLEPPESPPTIVKSRFDAATTGSMRGRLRWTGPIPRYAVIDAVIASRGTMIQRQYANPNGLRINSSDAALAGAVIYLEGVDPASARPWDLLPVRVEIHDEDIGIVQGNPNRERIGFVRIGDEIEMVSKDPAVQMLSVRGAAFFSLAFPDPDRPLRRKLSKPGLVEMSNEAAKYWQHAYLWVSDHPYFVLTDRAGRFALPQVPAGDYRLVCWHPNGRIAATDRDPNTGMVSRHHFADAFQTARPVSIHPGEELQLECVLGP